MKRIMNMLDNNINVKKQISSLKNKYGMWYYATFVVCILSMIAALYVILTDGQVSVHSDSAISYRFFKAIQASGCIYPPNWNAANGEIYAFNVMPISLLMHLLFKNVVFGRTLASAIMYLIVCVCFIWLFKCYFRNDGWLIAIPLYTVFISSGTARDMILIQSAYSATALAVSFCVGVFFKIVFEEYKIWHAVVHCILLFLMLAGGIRYIVEYIFPVCVTLAFELFYLCIKRAKVYNYKLAVVLMAGPSILGYVMYQLICHTHNMNFGDNSNPQIDLQLENIFENIRITILNALNIFGYNETSNIFFKGIIISITACICLVFPIMQLVRYKKNNSSINRYTIYGIVHNIVLLAAIILTGKTLERYLLSSIFICIIISSNYFVHVFNNKKITNYALIILFALLVLLLSGKLIKLSNGWHDRLTAIQQVSEQLLEHGIKKGYATYWTGYPNEAYSNGQIEFGAVGIGSGSLRKIYSNVDDSAFDYDEGPSCFMITQEEYDSFMEEYGVDIAQQLLGAPSDIFFIVNPNFSGIFFTDTLIVYVYENDVCEKLTDGLKDGLLTPLEMDFNGVGVRTAKSIRLDNGAIVHGPYLPVEKGVYTVTIEGDNLSSCGFDVYSESQPSNIRYTVKSKTDNKVVLDLTMLQGVNDIQFYITNNTNEEAQMYSVSLTKTK